jgi:ribosomal protein S18 acetylase RimI-like enzyme
VGARPLSDPEKHAKIGSGPPWLRWGVDLRDAEAWMDDDGPALALVRKRRAYGTSLVATGDPAAAVDLAVTLAPQLDVTSVTLPRASVVTAGAVFGPRPEGVDWEWMWTQEQPALVAGEDRVHRLDASSERVREELAAFLAVHSPRHSAEPDDDRARAWLGVRADDGELLACVALYEGAPGVDLMASVAVATAARGQGLGLAVAAAATRRSLRERPPVATVDLYSDNAVARALYTRLGYRLDQAFTSYRIA